MSASSRVAWVVGSACAAVFAAAPAVAQPPSPSPAPAPAPVAQPPAPPPPNCTAADLTGTMTGVMASTTAYLYTHPLVNDFFTALADLPPEERAVALAAFMDENPQTRAELQGIRQPMVDFRNRCGG